MVRTLTVVAVLVACVAPLAGAQRPLTIVADERLGSFRVKTDGTLGGAVRAFGAPTALRPTSDSSCTATWSRLGLTINLYNLGGGDPCSRRFGLFGRAIVRGPGWRTTKGLRVGDPVTRLRSLYRSARFHRGTRGFWPAGWWLVPRAEPVRARRHVSRPARRDARRPRDGVPGPLPARRRLTPGNAARLSLSERRSSFFRGPSPPSTPPPGARRRALPEPRRSRRCSSSASPPPSGWSSPARPRSSRTASTSPGVDVSGMAPAEAKALLEGRSARLATVPVPFVADGREFEIAPKRLGVEVDWAAAVDAARRQGEGFGPVRGFRRLQMRVFGADVAPPVQVYDAGLRYEVGRLAKAIARQPRRRGARAARAPARRRAGPGRSRARSRGGGADPRPGARRLRARARHAARPARAARGRRPPSSRRPPRRPAWRSRLPCTLTFGETRWRLPRWRIAELLALPKAGAHGSGDRRPWRRALVRAARRERQPPRRGRGLLRRRERACRSCRGETATRSTFASTSERLLARRCCRSTSRVAPLAVATAKPERTTADAQAMGITTQVGAYTTIVRRRGEPAAQRPARRRADRRRADRARRRVLVQRHDRRADRPTRASSRRP